MEADEKGKHRIRVMPSSGQLFYNKEGFSILVPNYLRKLYKVLEIGGEVT
jgi:hypothetical protein